MSLFDEKKSFKLDEIPNHSINSDEVKNKLIKISNIVKSLRK